MNFREIYERLFKIREALSAEVPDHLGDEFGEALQELLHAVEWAEREQARREVWLGTWLNGYHTTTRASLTRESAHDWIVGNWLSGGAGFEECQGDTWVGLGSCVHARKVPLVRLPLIDDRPQPLQKVAPNDA